MFAKIRRVFIVTLLPNRVKNYKQLQVGRTRVRPTWLTSATQMNLEHVPQADDDATTSSVCSPLVEEVGRRNGRIWNTKVTRVSEIEEISSELKSLVFTDPDILENAEINVIDSVGAEDISSSTSNSSGWKSDEINNHT